MAKLYKSTVFVLSLLLLSTSGESTEYKKTPGSASAYEVQLLSVDFYANGLGSVVARPCDDSVKCEMIYARIDSKTIFSNNEKVMTRREARRFSWHSGVIAIDAFGTAVSMTVIHGRTWATGKKAFDPSKVILPGREGGLLR